MLLPGFFSNNKNVDGYLEIQTHFNKNLQKEYNAGIIWSAAI